MHVYRPESCSLTPYNISLTRPSDSFLISTFCDALSGRPSLYQRTPGSGCPDTRHSSVAVEPSSRVWLASCWVNCGAVAAARGASTAISQ